MKRILTVILSLLIIFSYMPQVASAAVSKPEVEATTGILIDAHSGEILWKKNADVQMAPASMTKMMTALLTIENLDMDTVVTVDEEMAYTGGSNIGMIPGEKFTVEQLLKAMMVASANDCAVALAKTISGSVKDFANLMNGRAKELGCKDTHFVNPNGLDDSKHKSTAYDIARIAKAVMQKKKLRKIVKLSKYTVPKTNKHDERKLITTNRLLYDKSTPIDVNGVSRTPYWKNIIGVKTGYTDVAQGCLASCVRKDGTELIAVVMHSSDLGRFADSIALHEYGLSNFRTYDVYKKGEEVGKIKTKGSKMGKTPCVVSYYASACLGRKNTEADVTTQIEWVDRLVAPVAKGTKAGVMHVYKNGTEVSSVDVVTAEDAEAGVWNFIYTGKVTAPGKLIAIILLFLIILFALLILVLRIYNKRRRARRRRERAMRMAQERQNNPFRK